MSLAENTLWFIMITPHYGVIRSVQQGLDKVMSCTREVQGRVTGANITKSKASRPEGGGQ